jgi:multicomponent Na+:H+ antiporter subunit G
VSLVADIATIVLVCAGALLYLAGALGLLRFPDSLSRLHAISKADNLGLGLIVLGLLPQVSGVADGLKLVCVWLIAQLSAATASQLLARAVQRDRTRP